MNIGRLGERINRKSIITAVQVNIAHNHSYILQDRFLAVPLSNFIAHYTMSAKNPKKNIPKKYAQNQHIFNYSIFCGNSALGGFTVMEVAYIN